MSNPRPNASKPRGFHRDSRRHPKPRAKDVRTGLGLLSLTPREREVISRLVQGRTNRQIGTALKVSPRTIEKHVERILAKLGVANRTAAALLVTRARSL